MKINNISPLYSAFNFKVPAIKQNILSANTNLNHSNSINLNNLQYNDFLLFTGRVDKGLERFYNVNKDRMPITLKNYIDSLESKDGIEPIDALVEAFEGLIIAEDIQDVKDYFEDEPLFDNLTTVDSTRASKGLLYDIKVMKNDLDELGETVLNTGEDLSIYLLKKIYLEAKSLPEINKDLDNDLNPIFKKDNKKYIAYSTLESLGIKLPNKEYLTSLRYTKPGYSEEIGNKIAEIQKKRNVNRVPDISKNTKKTDKAVAKLVDSLKRDSKKTNSGNKSKRTQLSKDNWDKYTPEQKQEIIEKLVAASRFQRYVMINAWNNLEDVIGKMTDFFKSKNIHDTERILYNSTNYSNYLSAMMIAFWHENPECAQRLGEEISKSYELLRSADDNGTFEKTVEEIEALANKRKREIRKAKRKTKTDDLKKPEMNQEFKFAVKSYYPFLPDEFISDVAKFLGDKAEDKDIIQYFIKGLSQEMGQIKDAKFNEFIKTISCYESGTYINAIELAAKKILYESTNQEFTSIFSCDNPIKFLREVYNTEHFPLEITTKNIQDSDKKVGKSKKDEDFSFTVYKRPDFDKLDELYKKYKAKPSFAAKTYMLNQFKDTSRMFSKKSLEFICSNFDGTLFKLFDSYGAILDEIYADRESEASKYIKANYIMLTGQMIKDLVF